MVLLQLPAEIRTKATRTIINSVFSEWASINNDTPPPFRGWTAGTVNSVTGYGRHADPVCGNPAESPYPGAENWFACATFDNWEGWNEQQVQFYWKVIPDGTERSLRRSPSSPQDSA